MNFSEMKHQCILLGIAPLVYEKGKEEMMEAISAPIIDLVRFLKEAIGDKSIGVTRSVAVQTLKPQKRAPPTLHAQCLKRQKILPKEDFQKELNLILNSVNLKPDLFDCLNFSHLFKEYMKSLEVKHAPVFCRIALDLHNLLGLSYEAIDLLCRRYIFKDLSQIFNIEFIIPKKKLIQVNQEQQNLLETELGYCFDESGQMYYADPSRLLSWILKIRTGVYNFPKKLGLLIIYVDGYPLFSWSLNGIMQTSVQVRIIGAEGLMDIFSLARWFGDDVDKPDLAKIIFRKLDLLVINNVIFKVLWLFDGKARRFFLGKGAATSDYGIPEGPLLRSQFVDLSLICNLVSTSERTNKIAEEYLSALNLKKVQDTENFRRNFTRENFSDSGRENLLRADVEDVFPGCLHYCLNVINFICGILATFSQKLGCFELFIQSMQAGKFTRHYFYYHYHNLPHSITSKPSYLCSCSSYFRYD
eukprot:Pompholyxophrys_punicea_v1_NODE_498_length_1832_cov_7.698368.p1 type:complete len:472 gc:universal NODE_498_length_1832_cov_7.698368:347-1762(+)